MSASSVQWLDSLEEAGQQAAQQGRPILAHFSKRH